MAAPFLNKSSRYMYWDSLHFISPEEKDVHWMAECILFAKYNAKALVDQEKASEIRKMNRGVIDDTKYKKILDPVMPDGSGGKAEYFAADWKANPIFVHLDNIVEANMEKIPQNIYVKAADEYAKLKMQRENDRILSKKYFEKFVNDMNQQIGLPTLGKDEDPYRYVSNMGKSGAKAVPINMLDSIKGAIQDDEDLALFNEFIYKDGVEIAIELGVQHYFSENKYQRVAEKVIEDVKNFNASCVRFFTSKTTGRPQLQYIDPSKVMVSPFAKNDLSDIVFWFIEYDVTFGDFVRMFGASIKQECEVDGRAYDEVLKEIFDLNRNNIGGHGRYWNECSWAQRDAAKIRIGYIEIETQDFEVYSERIVRGNIRFRKEKQDFKVNRDMRKKYKTKKEERFYNCWYKAYYVPYRSGISTIQTSDFEIQAKYIFDFGKVQDQQREGDDYRYSKTSLVGWSSDKMSFFDIMNAYMPKINLLWFHFQNNLANAMPHGAAFADELINLMMDTTDDSNKNGKDSKFEMIRRLKQTGYGIFKMFDDEGNLINQGKPFAEVKTGHLSSARENLILMQDLYNVMTQALGINDVREGIDPKPRTSLGAIQMSFAASNNATYFIEKAYMDITLECARRMMYYFKDIVEYGDSERLQDFYDVVGRANGMAVESIKDIPLHRLGLSIHNIATDGEKQRVMFMADRMVASGQLDPDTVLFIARVDNLKYAEAILRLKYKQKQRELQEQAERNQGFIMEQKQMDLQIEMYKIDAKAKGEAQVWDLIKNWDSRIKELELMYKSQSQAALVDKRGENRQEQEVLKHNLDMKKELEKPLV